MPLGARTIDLSPGGLSVEIPSDQLEGLAFEVGQRLDVDVPLVVASKDRSSHIAYRVEVVRVAVRDAHVLVGCESLRARLRRSIEAEMSSYAM